MRHHSQSRRGRAVFARLACLFTVLLFLAASAPPALAQDAARGYVVVMAPADGSVPARAQELARTYGGRVGFVYRYALQGFSLQAPPRVATALASDPRIAYIEEDRPRSIFAQSAPTGVRRIFADENTNVEIDGTDDYRVDVDVAVIDTGIDFEHPDLNVAGGQNCMNSSGGGPPWTRTYYCESGGDDDHYHGTHVAGTIGAIDNGIGVVGVAPGARLWAVKVLDSNGSGSVSTVVAGIDWVAANADTIEVANMSLGGSGFSQAEYDAIQGAVDAGVAFAVAAGNSDDDASNYSPAAFDNVLTVSALADFDGEPGGLASPTCRDDIDDTLADFSNWGEAVQIAAPGVCILSTLPLEHGEYGTLSGTSMASPHGAGALALLASSSNPSDATDVGNLYNEVISAGNFEWIDGSGDGVQEPLLDVSDMTVFNPALADGSGDSGGDDADDPPAVTISAPADGASFDSGASISFAGSADDGEDGDLTGELVWTSDLDGQIGTGGAFERVLSDGTHTVTASVTDSGGNTSTDSVTVTVSGASDGFTLTVDAYKVRGRQYADLAWSGAGAGKSIAIYRDTAHVDTVADDDDGDDDGAGTYTDGPLGRGGGSASYYVCEADLSACSNPVDVSW